MKDWYHSTKEEVENMTYDEAKELIQKHIKLGHGTGDWRPRAHLTKALEIVLDNAEEYRKLCKEKI